MMGRHRPVSHACGPICVSHLPRRSSALARCLPSGLIPTRLSFAFVSTCLAVGIIMEDFQHAGSLRTSFSTPRSTVCDCHSPLDARRLCRWCGFPGRSCWRRSAFRPERQHAFGAERPRESKRTERSLGAFRPKRVVRAERADWPWRFDQSFGPHGPWRFERTWWSYRP
jgi:hypothetical protein